MVGVFFVDYLQLILRKITLSSTVSTNSVELSFTRYNRNFVEIFSELSKKNNVCA